MQTEIFSTMFRYSNMINSRRENKLRKKKRKKERKKERKKKWKKEWKKERKKERKKEKNSKFLILFSCFRATVKQTEEDDVDAFLNGKLFFSFFLHFLINIFTIFQILIPPLIINMTPHSMELGKKRVKWTIYLIELWFVIRFYTLSCSIRYICIN